MCLFTVYKTIISKWNHLQTRDYFNALLFDFNCFYSQIYLLCHISVLAYELFILQSHSFNYERLGVPYIS